MLMKVSFDEQIVIGGDTSVTSAYWFHIVLQRMLPYVVGSNLPIVFTQAFQESWQLEQSISEMEQKVTSPA